MDVVASTELGELRQGTVEQLLEAEVPTVALIFSSPPFRPDDPEYLPWLFRQFEKLPDLLADDGSMVVVLGNCWRPPVQSTETLEALMTMLHATGLKLLQMFVLHHAEMLLSPSVADEVAPLISTLGPRVPDVHSHAWWIGPAEAKARWQGTETSVLHVERIQADRNYASYCNAHGLGGHHAAMPVMTPEFFIRRLTDEGDLVVDPFAGSNATGYAAETLGRRWISVEPDEHFLSSSLGRLQGRLFRALNTGALTGAALQGAPQQGLDTGSPSEAGQDGPQKAG